jgi:hypothetical protein
MRAILALLVSLTALLPSGASYSQTPPVAMSADQVAAIHRLLSSTFDKPESRLSLDPIAPSSATRTAIGSSSPAGVMP